MEKIRCTFNVLKNFMLLLLKHMFHLRLKHMGHAEVELDYHRLIHLELSACTQDLKGESFHWMKQEILDEEEYYK